VTQTTLVSHYGRKPTALESYLKQCQQHLAAGLSTAFKPYAIEQIHATIIGLEGCRRVDQIENINFRQLRQEARCVDPAELLSFLRSSSLPSFDVRIGGYAAAEKFRFLSQGKHPHVRSFSILGVIAVAMGWPADGSNVLDDLRRSFGQINVLHKWHKTESDIDNDFFFVLGRIDPELTGTEAIASAEQVLRRFMAEIEPVTIPVDLTTLRVVSYSDTQLPLGTSRAYAIDEPALTADLLLQGYDDCEA